MKEIFDTWEVWEGEKTWEEYYGQFESVIPELGKTYAQHPDTWQQRTWKVIFINADVALCESLNPFNKTQIEYDLFRVKGLNHGWRKDDPRPSYRLREISEKVKA